VKFYTTIHIISILPRNAIFFIEKNNKYRGKRQLIFLQKLVANSLTFTNSDGLTGTRRELRQNKKLCLSEDLSLSV